MRAGRPLPSVELYDPAAPQRGLLALLKHALWQTLWVDNGPPSGVELPLDSRHHEPDFDPHTTPNARPQKDTIVNKD